MSNLLVQQKTKVRILAITDHEELTSILQDTFGHTGRRFDIHLAASGEEGIDFARRENPDVVLMDMSLHSLSGIDAARRIKAFLPRCKIIFLTMYLCDDSPVGI